MAALYILNFFVDNVTAQKVINTISNTTKISASLLNSGTVGLGDVELLESSDITETVSEKALATKTSPLAESYVWPDPPAVTLAIIA